MLSMHPIGYVRSPYKDTGEIPKGLGAKHEAEGVLDIRAEFEPGLTDIEGFSHLFVIWVFDRSEGFNLVGTPPSDDRPHGLHVVAIGHAAGSIRGSHFPDRRLAERVEHRAGLQLRALRQIHHHLHAYGPLAVMVAIRHTELRVGLPADRPYRPVSHHGQGRANIHTGHETGFRFALPVDALVAQAHAANAPVFHQRGMYRRSRPDLDRARTHQFSADELHELAQRHH